MIKIGLGTCVSISDVGTSKRIAIYNSPVCLGDRTRLEHYGPYVNCIPTNVSTEKGQYVDLESGELVRRMRYYSTEVYSSRLAENAERSRRRARTAIVDLARLNAFTHFGTLTLDDNLIDASDIEGATRKMLSALKSYKQLAPDFKYILVPEFGEKNHRLHFHFLMKGIRAEDLAINENYKLEFKYFRKRFGFTQITPIVQSRGDIERTAIYCGKYIGKDNIQVFKRRYFCSLDLVRVSKTRISSVYTARSIERFLRYYPETLYYKDKALSYDVPQPLYEKLKDFVFVQWCKALHPRYGRCLLSDCSSKWEMP